jgi:hypothetical protein
LSKAYFSSGSSKATTSGGATGSCARRRCQLPIRLAVKPGSTDIG